jgi:Mg2+/Co2+ transporter CorB
MVVSDQFLFICVLGLILLSGFFSSAETGLFSLNRYRIQHLAKKGNKAARCVRDLLLKPDRLLGVILIGNTLSNMMAASLTAIIAVHWFGESGVWLAALLLTLVVLIFAEITPKTVAAFYPERLAFFACRPLKGLLFVFYPLVFLANIVANAILFVFGFRRKKHLFEPLTREEIRSLVSAQSPKPGHYEHMLLGVLDLETSTVNDIMVPRNEAEGINIDAPWRMVVDQLRSCRRMRALVYDKHIDQPLGFVYLPKVIDLLIRGSLTRDALVGTLDPLVYIPEQTLLHQQLKRFQSERCSMGLIVDEYGDIIGMVALDDIFEEIVGQFTERTCAHMEDLEEQKDGSYVVGGNMHIRDLNRALGWHFPVDGPNTLGGLIVERMEMIPTGRVSLRVAGYPVEVVELKGHKIERIKVFPALYEPPEDMLPDEST